MRSIGRQRGFSLLEILVAFVILSLSLGVIMRLFSGGMRNVGVAEHYTHAALLAENVFNGLGMESPLNVGGQSGEDGKGYRWRAQVGEYDAIGEAVDAPATPVRLYRVDVEVSWGDSAERASSLKFSTLRLRSTQ